MFEFHIRGKISHTNTPEIQATMRFGESATPLVLHIEQIKHKSDRLNDVFGFFNHFI